MVRAHSAVSGFAILLLAIILAGASQAQAAVLGSTAA